MNKYLNDTEIKRLCRDEQMISPFFMTKISHSGDNPVISYGLQSFGYDIRLSGPIYYPNCGIEEGIIDPKRPMSIQNKYVRIHNKDFKGAITIPPMTTVIGTSLEIFKMPKNIFGEGKNKSTYERSFIRSGTAPIEPGWSGRLTIPITNLSDFTNTVYIGEGILQIQFYRGEEPYSGYNGRYQNITHLQFGKV